MLSSSAAMFHMKGRDFQYVLIRRYDSATDAVVVLMDCTFSDRHWSLGKVEQPLPVNINLYRYFAQFFLDGSVCPQLVTFADKLLLSPSAMTKPWAKLQRRTENLLNSLIEYEVSLCIFFHPVLIFPAFKFINLSFFLQVTSRAHLLEVWKSKSEYLLDEYLEWIPQFLHENVQMSWPPN